MLGAALSAAGQLSVGVLYYGVEPFRQWMRVLWNVRTVLPLLEPKLYQTHSLRTFWSMLVPWAALSSALYFLSAAFVIGLTIACWRRDRALPLRYSALLFASVLVAPHLTVYDLVILAPAFLLLADWLVTQPLTASSRRMGILLYLVYMLPLIGPFARWTHVQLSVIAMAATLYLLVADRSRRQADRHRCTNHNGCRQRSPVGRELASKNTYPDLPNRNVSASRKPLRPCRLMVRSTLVDHEPKTSMIQPRATQDRSQFSHVIDHALILIFPPRFGSSGCQENPFRPAFDCAALAG